MGIRINQNVAALGAARSIRASQQAVQQDNERLSSALRINRAADDPAGLVVSEHLRVQGDELSVRSQGAERGAGDIQTAEGRLGEVFNQLEQIRTRALDSLNAGASGLAARAANQTAAASSARSIGRNLAQVDTTGRGVDSSGLAGISQNLSGLDLTTPEGARKALNTVDQATQDLSSFRGQLGARQANDLESQFRSFQAGRENIAASESGVRDADFATEVSNLGSDLTRQGAGLSALRQSNESQRSALRLIGGDERGQILRTLG